MEKLFPLGDLRWLILSVLIASPTLWLYRSELINFTKRKLKKKPREIRGAPQQRFKLYEAACLLANVEPAWQLPNQLSMDKLDFLIDAVRVHDPDVKHVDLRVVIPSYAMRPLDLTNFALRQHTYISQLRIRDAQQIARLRDVKLGITCKELDREALHNVAVDRKVLREYLESKSRPVPEFLHESHDRPDSDSERED